MLRSIPGAGFPLAMMVSRNSCASFDAFRLIRAISAIPTLSPISLPRSAFASSMRSECPGRK
jgi:hypothetical protein